MIERGGWRAAVTRTDPVRDQLVLRIGRPVGDGMVEYLRCLARGGCASSDLPPVLVPAHEDPLDLVDIRIDETVAQLLLDLLIQHYGAPGSVQLRKDFEYERAARTHLETSLLDLLAKAGGCGVCGERPA